MSASFCPAVLTNEEAVKAYDGMLDLSGWDFRHDGLISLDKRWEFYWEKLLAVGDFERTAPDLYVNVPRTWDSYTVDGSRLPGLGYATYRLRVKTAVPTGTRVHTACTSMAN